MSCFFENFKTKIVDERFSLDQYRRVEVVHLVKLQRHLSTTLPNTYLVVSSRTLLSNKTMTHYLIPSTETPTIESAIALSILTKPESIITITLEQNTYKSSIELGRIRDNVDLGIGLKFTSNGNRTFIINGNNSILNAGIRVTNGNTVTINDLHITNPTRNNSGYGCFCEHSKLTLNNCSIRSCNKIGLWCYLNSTVNITNTTIERNKEAGVCCYFALCNLTNCTLTANNDHGLIVSGTSSKATITSSTVTRNNEAAIWCVSGGTIDIEDSEISHNNDGLVADEHATINYKNCQFNDNKCDTYEDEGKINKV